MRRRHRDRSGACRCRARRPGSGCGTRESGSSLPAGRLSWAACRAWLAGRARTRGERDAHHARRPGDHAPASAGTATGPGGHYVSAR